MNNVYSNMEQKLLGILNGYNNNIMGAIIYIIYLSTTSCTVIDTPIYTGRGVGRARRRFAYRNIPLYLFSIIRTNLNEILKVKACNRWAMKASNWDALTLLPAGSASEWPQGPGHGRGWSE